jgi:hypothetical protein
MGHVGRREKVRNVHTILIGKLEEKIHLGDLGTDRRITLN